jgi:hypothetical protein
MAEEKNNIIHKAHRTRNRQKSSGINERKNG